MNYMYASFVLHAHLPYIRHKEANRLEERWLYEAITESYIPLLWQLEKPDHHHNWTISFSPPLMEMLADTLIQRRYLHYLDKSMALIQLEKERAQTDREQEIVRFYEERYIKVKDTFIKWHQNILEGFKHFYDIGKIDCITSSATHTFLPYLQTKQGVSMQIKHGISTFERYFGVKPKGFWLPECGFTPGIDKLLHLEGIRYTFVDEHTIRCADPTPSKSIGAPLYSPHGIVLFPRNQEITNMVWSSSTGYPGDYDYREFYRDIAYDREMDYILPFIHPDGIRVDTGLKFHRITGKTEGKDLYVPKWASDKVKRHADHFASVLEGHKDCKGDQSFPPYLVTLPFDAELFGHWWFEGPEWLHEVISRTINQVEWITPLEFINRHYQDLETAHVSFSTWGRDGYGDVWLNESNEWMYRHMHEMERSLIAIVSDSPIQDELTTFALQQLTREWMLATSSDWAFILDNNSASEYATNRFKEHVQRFYYLHDKVKHNMITEELVMKLKGDYPFLQEIDLTPLLSEHDQYIIDKRQRKSNKNKKVVMLTWEFPPRIVGGLARHVCELAKTLVEQGMDVYVLTTNDQNTINYEEYEGIHVYRVPAYQREQTEFLHWIGSMNLCLLDEAMKLAQHIHFDLIHAHDWLVYSSSVTLKSLLNIPLITTIHATENGRNQGIYTSIQVDIQEMEIDLIRQSDKVIVCSDFMKKEVITLEKSVESKICVIPNGVDQSFLENKTEESNRLPLYNQTDDQIVFSIGRMVPEKGFETIIDAAPMVLTKFTNVRFILAGSGPLEKKYDDLIQERGLQERIQLVGFVNDKERNERLRTCVMAVFPSTYEPFGIAALEAMIAKKPVIVSNTGGLTSFVQNGITGITVEPESSEELAEAIIALLSNPSLADKIAQNAQQVAIEEYNWDHIGVRTVLLYRDILNKDALTVT
ncbi:1,4-alpha-glucan branching protein domain-containing protein [Bacillus salitolerans]|uniref:1,4-alpha-glucan branching protein domain-containing protein n=1 Tax=Bacillus salitolerans TaxID=1437434 RepID=A0ABW4LNW2_9BACI